MKLKGHKMQQLKAEATAPDNLAQLLREHAAERPNDIAVFAKYYRRSKGRSYAELSFGDLDRDSDKLAWGLQERGVQRGTRVMLLVPPGIEFVTLWFALLKLGAVTILIDPGMGGRNLRTCITDVQPEVLVSIPIVHAVRRFFPRIFSSVRLAVSLGRRASIGGVSLHRLYSRSEERFPLASLALEDTTAITFTTGSTGIPKGVRCTHETFLTQLSRLQESFNITSADVGFPAFLPFALYCIALGSKTVMPDINPRRPADADPEAMFRLLEEQKVTYSFGSPAFWSPLADACVKNNWKLSLTRVIMFGAPIPLDLHRRIYKSLGENAHTHTPYGATEALPVTSFTGAEVIAETGIETAMGAGVCVGKAVSQTDVRIIPIKDGPISNIDFVEFLEPFAIGEVIVLGGQVSTEYINRPEQTALAKIPSKAGIWHRMGDLGYLDSSGRLWFCGRKNHRVQTKTQTLFTVPTESVFNQHQEVRRSALIGVGELGSQIPVLCVELFSQAPDTHERLRKELRAITRQHPHLEEVVTFLFHPAFPVDFRHNAKIIREELREWASTQLGTSQ